MEPPPRRTPMVLSSERSQKWAYTYVVPYNNSSVCVCACALIMTPAVHLPIDVVRS